MSQNFVFNPRPVFAKIFHHFDDSAHQTLGRNLTEDEKALAHTAIVHAFEMAKRERIPFSAAFEKNYSFMPGRGEFSEVYEVLRRKRGHLEKLLEAKNEIPKPLSAPFSAPPLLELETALGTRLTDA